MCKISLEGVSFHDICGSLRFLLVSCLSGALGFWGGLRPGSGVSFGASVVLGGFISVRLLDLVLSALCNVFKHFILLPRRAPPGCS